MFDPIPPANRTMTTIDQASAPAQTTAAERQAARRRISAWLFVAAGMVFAMAVIGAITRLTESGLSMAEWRPLIGALPPLSQAEWDRVFDLYRQTPEYRLINTGMSLDDFKTIFFWEWLHRLWGRLIGVVFALPLLWFWLAGTIRRTGLGARLGWTLIGLLVLGGLQGVLGWVMVQSGLVDRPSVSHYRLAAHLGLAFLIFGLLIWVGLSVRGATEAAGAAPGPRRHGWVALVLISVTVLWGAMVAGLDAGLAYNTFPLMNGALLPPEALSIVPAWLNLFDNTALVQFIHRWLAIISAIVVLALAVRAWRVAAWRGLATWLGVTVLFQVGLGIATLLLGVPIVIATLHQAGALTLVALLVGLQWRMTRHHAA
ncbi:MAG: COX15/CtaA family protein [Pseudomonadota bacterium]